MRNPVGRRYVEDEAQLAQLLREIKQLACPHCGHRGHLIRHGSLRGYAERSQAMKLRGRRVFCSNRFRAAGCGRTFSLLLATTVAGFIVRASTLGTFLKGFVEGLTLMAAWFAACAGAMSRSSGYRLFRRLRDAQSTLRSHLSRLGPPPACSHGHAASV